MMKPNNNVDLRFTRYQRWKW